MSDTEYNEDTERIAAEEERIAAEKRRNDENIKMKAEWKGNLAKFSESFSLFMKNNPPLTSESDRFFIAQLQFTDGEESSPHKVITKVINSISDAHKTRAENNAARIAKEIASGKPAPSIPDFIKFYDVTSILHQADDTGVTVVINAKNQKIANAITQHILEKIGSPKGVDGCGKLDMGFPNETPSDNADYKFTMLVPKDSLPSKNPYIDCDLIHKAAFDYFIENKITARSEDDVDASEYFSIY